MADISKIQLPGDDTAYNVKDNAAERSANKVTSISSASTDTQFPSAKAVYALFNSIPNANEVSY